MNVVIDGEKKITVGIEFNVLKTRFFGFSYFDDISSNIDRIKKRLTNSVIYIKFPIDSYFQIEKLTFL